MQTDKPGSLSDRFDGFGAAPTDHLWDSIAMSLDQKEKKKRGAFWWWFGGIAAGLTLIFSVYQIGYHFGKQETGAAENTASNQLTEQNQSNQTTAETVIADTPSKLENAEVIEKGQPENGIRQNPDQITQQNHSQTATAIELTQYIVPVENDTQSKEVLTTDRKIVPIEIIETDVNAMPLAGIENLAALPEPLFYLKSIPVEKRKSNGEWEFGLHVGTLRGYEATNQNLIINTSNQQQSLADFEALDVNSITGSGNPPEPFIVNNPSSEVKASIKRPVNIEFSIARTFGRRWSLGSGVGLNYFTGQNTYTTPAGMEVRCNFLSISVPLTADFDFIKRRRFEVSAGLGVVNEFPFRMITETTNADPTAPVLTKEFNRGYMGSALIRTGFSYRLNEHLKVGLSPSIRYYFHQSLESEIPVLKRNLWGGISLGAIWEL